MTENKFCPCCGRHCDLNEPHCERGKEYARTGIIPEGGHKHEHGDAHHIKHQNICKNANYDNMDTNNKLIINLRNLGHMIRFLFEGKGSQKRVLIILRESGSMTQRELTERMGIQPGSASEVIGKLESAGLIERKPSQQDRRTTDITLTELGKIQANEAANQRERRHSDMFSCLSSEEKNILLSLTEKLNSDWDNRFRENADAFKNHKHHEKHGSHLHHSHHGGFHHHNS